MIAVDDLQLPAVARAVAFCVSNLGWTVEERSDDDPSHHWLVLRTPRPPVDRAWDHFVDF